jgi:hypothetical protein
MREYNDLFPTTFTKMKGIERELGEMNIPFKPQTRPIRKRPYRPNPVYKQKVKAKIDRMLEVGIIKPVEKSKWISPMVVLENKQGGIRICMDISKLNYALLHDHFPTPFTNEVLENVRGHEVYSFTDGFSRYHQIKRTLEDMCKTTFLHNGDPSNI